MQEEQNPQGNARRKQVKHTAPTRKRNKITMPPPSCRHSPTGRLTRQHMCDLASHRKTPDSRNLLTFPGCRQFAELVCNSPQYIHTVSLTLSTKIATSPKEGIHKAKTRRTTGRFTTAARSVTPRVGTGIFSETMPARIGDPSATQWQRPAVGERHSRSREGVRKIKIQTQRREGIDSRRLPCARKTVTPLLKHAVRSWNKLITKEIGYSF